MIEKLINAIIRGFGRRLGSMFASDLYKPRRPRNNNQDNGRNRS